MNDTLLLAEVAEALASHGSLRCVVTTDIVKDQLVITMSVRYGLDLEATELKHTVDYVADIAQLRMLATRYGIEPEKLEGFLKNRQRVA